MKGWPGRREIDFLMILTKNPPGSNHPIRKVSPEGEGWWRGGEFTSVAKLPPVKVSSALAGLKRKGYLEVKDQVYIDEKGRSSSLLLYRVKKTKINELKEELQIIVKQFRRV